MNKLYNDTAVQAIANAIRAKNGSSDTYTIAEMSTALNDLSYYAKPTIENVPLATFEADGLPLNSLKVSVEVKQEGSGTPSPENVRPISGWSEVNVSDVGANFWDEQWVIGDFSSTTGEMIQGNYLCSKNYIPVIPNTLFFFFSGEEGTPKARFYIYQYDKNKNYLGVSYYASIEANTAFVTSPDAYFIKFERGGLYGTVYQNNMSVILNTSEHKYYPYNGTTTTTISLGQTVYGAEVDVVNGILKITDGYIASYNGETLPSTWISSMDVYAEGTSPTTGAEVCYELANPIITNLTPSLIKSLEGTNNLSVDCGDVLELEYFKEV